MAIVSKDGTVEHAGFVLRFESRDERIMSDVYALVKYAIVIVPETGAELAVRVGDCEFGNHSSIASYAVDATPEALALHGEWLIRRDHAETVARQAADAAARARAERQLRKGKRCVVARGRKVPKGTEGVCIWIGDGHYGERCGVKDDSGTVHWTASKNVDVIMSA